MTETRVTYDVPGYPPFDPDRMLKIPEVADRMRCSARTIQNRLSTHPDSLPPAYKVGGRILFRASEVEAWIDAQRLGA